MTGEELFILACAIFVYGRFLLWIRAEEQRMEGKE